MWYLLAKSFKNSGFWTEEGEAHFRQGPWHLPKLKFTFSNILRPREASEEKKLTLYNENIVLSSWCTIKACCTFELWIANRTWNDACLNIVILLHPVSYIYAYGIPSLLIQQTITSPVILQINQSAAHRWLIITPFVSRYQRSMFARRHCTRFIISNCKKEWTCFVRQSLSWRRTFVNFSLRF